MNLSESEFCDRIEAEVLAPEFGAEQVEREPTLASGRRPDFLIETPIGTVAVEVGTSEASLLHDAGQALAYAAEVGGVPVVLTTPEAAESTEASIIKGSAVTVAGISTEGHAPSD